MNLDQIDIKANLLKSLGNKIYMLAYICTCMYVVTCVNPWENVSMVTY